MTGKLSLVNVSADHDMEPTAQHQYKFPIGNNTVGSAHIRISGLSLAPGPKLADPDPRNPECVCGCTGNGIQILFLFTSNTFFYVQFLLVQIRK